MKSLALIFSLATAALSSSLPERASTWSGWKGVKHLFVFGDSYTQTGFNPNSTQPSPSNPFGNPPYPGWTSCNGPNWVGFLTATYNTSKLLTYNLAYGGATVDSALVAPYTPSVLSLKNQVLDQWVPTYSSQKSVGWTPEDSLFAFWIGINDVGNSWWLSNATSLYDEIFTVYDTLLEKIYAVGARNFLFLSVPPINFAPLTLQNGEYAVENEGKMIGVWNEKLGNMTSAFAKRHASSPPKIFAHDTFGLFTRVIADPGSYAQTSGYKNVTGYCTAYENGTPTWYSSDPSCLYPVNEYLWLNNLHPTFPIHNATAASIVQTLNA